MVSWRNRFRSNSTSCDGGVALDPLQPLDVAPELRALAARVLGAAHAVHLGLDDGSHIEFAEFALAHVRRVPVVHLHALLVARLENVRLLGLGAAVEFGRSKHALHHT